MKIGMSTIVQVTYSFAKPGRSQETHFLVTAETSCLLNLSCIPEISLCTTIGHFVHVDVLVSSHEYSDVTDVGLSRLIPILIESGTLPRGKSIRNDADHEQGNLLSCSSPLWQL